MATNKSFAEEYAQAVAQGEVAAQHEPRARAVRYDAAANRIVVELMNECTFMFPPESAQDLAGASALELADVRVMPQGFALEWPQLDAHFSVAGLLAGIFGSKKWMAAQAAREMGRVGGAVSSPAKTTAVRANGRKGGRPAKRQEAA